MKYFLKLLFAIVLSLTLFSSQVDAGQCQATTKKGTQCKRNASSGSSYCWQHGGKTQSTSPSSNKAYEGKKYSAPKEDRVTTRCQATTKKGAQCKRNAKAGSSYCWQHGG